MLNEGVAGSIGARQLQHDAAELEVALRRGATSEDLEPLLDTVERTLDDLVGALARTLPPESEVTPVAVSVEPDALAAAVAQLEQLLSSGAGEAVDAFEEAGPILAAAFGERVTQIGKLIGDYCFEDALAELRDLARR